VTSDFDPNWFSDAKKRVSPPSQSVYIGELPLGSFLPMPNAIRPETTNSSRRDTGVTASKVSAPSRLRKTHKLEHRLPFDSVALLLQGGGALGAYQAGVYEAPS
jgi:hypothetical protein